jgi:hypothetical protein
MDKSEFLRLRIDFDSDCTCELTAEVCASGFRGRGSAWFDLTSLKDFAQTLKAYPLSLGDLPHLEGGFWEGSTPARLVQTHLSIRVYPLGHRGHIGVRVCVADPSLSEGDRAESQNVAEIELETSYNALHNFANELERLLAGGLDVATLASDRLG